MDTGVPTGTTKANDPNDPDYIPPFVDDTECPPPTPPPVLVNQLAISFVNATSQSISLNSLQLGPLSGQSAGTTYYANTNFTILPNITFNAPIVGQSDNNSYLSYGVVGLSKKIRTLMSITYQPSNESSPSDILDLDIVEQQSVNQHFPTQQVAGTNAGNILVIKFTEDPVIPPVLPNPPVVTAGASQSVQLPVSIATLNGTLSSTDPATTVLWTQVSGPSTATITTPTGVQTTVGTLIQGTYIFRLTATDSNNQTGSAQTTVQVNPAATNPNGLVNILVDPNMPDNTYQIAQITLYDMVNTNNAPIALLTMALNRASGVTVKNPLKGTYRMVIAIVGVTAGSKSLSVSWAGNSSSSQSFAINLPQAGSYAFDNVVVDEGSNGVLINYSSVATSSPSFTVLFAHMVTASSVTQNQNQLPNDLIVTQVGNITIETFSDAALTTPASFTGNISYTSTVTNNLTSTSFVNNDIVSFSAQDSVVVATIQRYQHYDYSQGTPLVEDDSYAYALVAGQGYLII